MTVNSHLKESICRNFKRRKKVKDHPHFYKKQYSDQYVKLDATGVYTILQSAQGKFKTPATKLMHKLASSAWWTISATAHEGGQDPNAPLHITIGLPKEVGVHVYLKELYDGTKAVREITLRKNGKEIELDQI